MDRKSGWLFLVFCAAAGFFAASPAAKALETPPPHAADAAHTPMPAALTFKVGVLEENDGADELQGCTTGLTRVGAGPSVGDTFRESSSDTQGDGFIRIDGKLLHVTLVSASQKGRDATLVFEDAAHTVKVVEAVKTGVTNENADSTALSGTLTVTYKGATQTLRVEGGVAC